MGKQGVKLRTLASGSDGNCSVLTDSNGEVLILDCGIHFRKILKGIGFGIQKIQGVCVTHRHKDHSMAAERFKGIGCTVIESSGSYQCGKYRIKTFDLVHDVPCIGFCVTHPEMGTLVYLTDTEYCKYRFRGVKHLIVECNYDKTLLNRGHPSAEHVLTGHMELETVKTFVTANKNNLQNVILCHMSQSHLDFNKALSEVQDAAGEHVNVVFATVNEEMELNA